MSSPPTTSKLGGLQHGMIGFEFLSLGTPLRIAGSFSDQFWRIRSQPSAISAALGRKTPPRSSSESLDDPSAWLDVVFDGRLHDTMFLEALIRLARKDEEPVSRNLGMIAKNYLGLYINKDDPYRLRYSELIGKPWETAEAGFFSYAIKDAVVTWKLYQTLSAIASSLVAPVRDQLLPGHRRRFGLLTESLQVRGAIAMADIERNGLSLDEQQVDAAKARLSTEVSRLVAEIDPLAPGLFKRTKKSDDLKLTASGKPSTNRSKLIEMLEAKHHTGKGSRIVPIFSDLMPILRDAWDLLPEKGSDFVIEGIRSGDTNLRTQAHRIIKRAGFDPWPKTFQNLRSSLATDLAEHTPLHIAAEWTGHTVETMRKFYLQVTKEHREKARRREKEAKAKQLAEAVEAESSETDGNRGTNRDTKAKQKAKQSVPEKASQEGSREVRSLVLSIRNSPCPICKVAAEGLEPPTRGL